MHHIEGAGRWALQCDTHELVRAKPQNIMALEVYTATTSVAEHLPPPSKLCLHPSFNVVLVDQDNVRAGMGWPAGQDFRQRVCAWAAALPVETIVIIEVDERKRSESRCPRARQVKESCVLIVYSGAQWRADDGIVRDAEWWLSQQHVANVQAITSDKLVRRRCSDVKHRLGCEVKLRFESAEAFGFGLPAVPELPSTSEGPSVPLPLISNSFTPKSSEGAVPKFLAWIESELPRPTKTAAEFIHSGERQRRGSKRRLGVYA